MDNRKVWSKQLNTTAHKTYLKISDVNLMGHIHLDNFNKLQTELGAFNNINAVFNAINDRDNFRKQHLNVSTLFFNYLLSAISLRDSTRNLIKIKNINLKTVEIKSNEIIQDDFIKNPTIKLLEDLRNIITHQSMLSPSISSYINKENGFSISGFAYGTESLIDNNRLTRQTKDYLNKLQPKYLFLLPVVEEYQSITLKYQHWLLNTILNIHQETFKEYWISRINVVDEWGGDMPIIPSESTISYLTR